MLKSGLASLLQDLTNGMDPSDKEDKEDIQRRHRYSRWSVHSSGMYKDNDKVTVYKAVSGRVGHRMQNSMEPGRDGRRVDVLMYAHSEDNEHENTNQQRTMLEAGKPSPIPLTTSPQSSPPMLYLISLFVDSQINIQLK